MIELRDYQKDIVDRAVGVLRERHIVYLMMEVRTGKSYTAFAVAKAMGCSDNEILVVTKKGGDKSNVLTDITAQSEKFGISPVITNYESVHKVSGPFRLVIIDEAHNLGTYPKPSLRWKKVKAVCSGADIIFLSGTATPEGWSTLYHQFALSDWSPFSDFGNFYRWADKFVNKTTKYLGSIQVADYSKAKIKEIDAVISPYRITCTQEEAGFTTEIEESILEVELSGHTHSVYEYMRDNSMIVLKEADEAVLGDSAAALMTKCHQVASGTLLNFESIHILDLSKGYAIKRNAKMHGFRKIAVYYKYRAELLILEKVFTGSIIGTPEEFQRSDEGVFVSQVVSGREGIRLDTADALYMFNIDYAYVSYEQTRNRIMSFERARPAKLIWVFGDTGFERNVLKKVMNKENFTTRHFRRMK